MNSYCILFKTQTKNTATVNVIIAILKFTTAITTTINNSKILNKILWSILSQSTMG